VIVVDFYGNMPDWHAILPLGKRRGITVIQGGAGLRLCIPAGEKTGCERSSRTRHDEPPAGMNNLAGARQAVLRRHAGPDRRRLRVDSVGRTPLSPAEIISHGCAGYNAMQVIFIGGSQRSGTTLLQTLLVNALPHAPLLPEAHVFIDILKAYRRSLLEWERACSFFSSRSDLDEFFTAALDQIIARMRARYGQDCSFVLKEPNFAHVASELHTLFPEAIVIFCVRDPRDIAASFIKIGERQVQKGMATHYTKRNLIFICRKINESYDFSGAVSLGFQLAFYEEVVADPASWLAQLATKTRLDLSARRIESLDWLDEERRHQETWVTELEGGPPVPDSVGSFKTVLSPEETARVEELCGDLMKRFGYDPVGRQPIPEGAGRQ
jgi:hypothetical protein